MASVVVGAAMFGGIMVLPLYMQIVHGASPMRSGFLMLPMVVGMMSASIISGQVISRTGRIRSFPLDRLGADLRDLFLLSFITADTDLLLVMAIMFGLGLRAGQLHAAAPADPAVRRTPARHRCRDLVGHLLPPDRRHPRRGDLPVGALRQRRGQHQGRDPHRVADPAFQQAVQTASQSSNQLDRQVADAFLHPTPGGGVLAQVQNDSSIIQQMPATLAHPFKAGFADSMDTVFLLAGCVAILAFLVLLLMPKVELRATSASAAARSEAAPTAPVDRPGLTHSAHRGTQNAPSRRKETRRVGAKRHPKHAELSQADSAIDR